MASSVSFSSERGATQVDNEHVVEVLFRSSHGEAASEAENITSCSNLVKNILFIKLENN